MFEGVSKTKTQKRRPKTPRTKKDQITRGDKESLTRRMQSLLFENLVLGKKSNQQTKTTKTKTPWVFVLVQGVFVLVQGSSF